MKNYVIDAYEEKSKKMINDSFIVKEFKEIMEEKKTKIKDFRVNNSILYKLTHPVKVVKNAKESIKLRKIQSTYDYYYKASVLMYIVEETGDIYEDLNHATNIEKPKYIESYIKSLNLKK